jgi:tRNA pseudouridine13 synthase
MASLPYLTRDLPGTGGVLRASPEDFLVEELPAYPTTGEGTHVFVWIEKRGLTTPEAVKRLAGALRVRPADIGAAGKKDRHAVTRQWLSLPPPLTPEQALAVQVDGLQVLEARRHGHKLRTGHVKGNRFVLVVRELACPADEAARRAQAVLDVLARPPGVPNFYGEQRFGRSGDNAAQGKALLKGERLGGRSIDARFLLSALQSALFNHVLAARLEAGTYRTVQAGDVLVKVQSGGQFVCEDPAVDQPRLETGEVAPSGPMFGGKMREPTPGSPAASAEAAALAAFGLAAADFARARQLDGTRRPLGVPFVEPPSAEAMPDQGGMRLTFALPAGAYATVVAREIMKNDCDVPADADSASE